MPVIAIVGAGPGLGLSIARRSGGDGGFQIALLARRQTALDDLVERLAESGIEAAGFTADVLDGRSLVDAFERVRQRFGEVDVLEFSPANHTGDPIPAPVAVLEATPDTIQAQIELYVYGVVAAVQQVLPGMLARGAGTLLFTTGASSVTPVPPFGNIGSPVAVCATGC